MRKHDEAAKKVQETLDLDPIQQRRYADGIAEMRRSLELGGEPEDVSGGLAFAYGISGDRASANTLIAELQRRLANGSSGPFPIALAYTGLGETTRALEYLNRAIDVHDIFLPEDFFDPQLDLLRGDPRFRKIEERMQIPPQSPSQ